MNARTLLLLALLAAMPATASIHLVERYAPPPGARFPDGLTVAARSVDVTGECAGEFISLAQSLRLRGTILGDVLSMALDQDVRVTGNQDLYLVGENIAVGGWVDGNVSAAGKDVSASSLTVGENLRVAAGVISLDARVRGTTLLWGKEISVSGSYDDLLLTGSSIRLEKGTVVRGNLTYRSAREAVIDPSANILGTVTWRPVGGSAFRRLRRLFSFFSLVVPFLVMLLFTPNLLILTTRICGRHPVRMFFLGLAFCALSALALLLCFISIIGFSLGLIGSAWLLGLLYLVRPIPAIALARLLLRRFPERRRTWLLAVIIGVVAFELASAIPRASIYVNAVCLPVGFAAFLTGRLRFFRHLRQEGVL